MLSKILYSAPLVLFLFFTNRSVAQQLTNDSGSPFDSTQRVQKIVSEKSDAIIEYAKKFMGVPYVWGGMSPSGFDCSGFINYVFKGFGFGLTRTSYGLAELGKTVRLSELRPGDLMFFKARNLNTTRVGHVALVVDTTDGIIQFIHAARTGIRIDTFNNSSYYVPRYIKSKRMDYIGY
ncbi:MAG: C40 family peptidase [Crocinitomicaceae bacterium]|nr:C40 family peptidase [Flavobacteriales bacterium]MDO7614727.1 C40 family peptidase [Crocinitomicaceae bacterium]